MKHRSQKRRNLKIQRGLLIAVVLLLVGSFIFSWHQKRSQAKENNFTSPTENTHHKKGASEARYSLVEYSDFQCPACRSVNTMLANAMKDNPGLIELEFRHFPLRSIHGNAQAAAEAAEAAGIQGKFWEMHDLLFEKQSEWNRSINPKRHFQRYAKELGLDTDRFKHDLDSDYVREVVNEEYQQAEDLKLTGTPSFLLDGEEISFSDFMNDKVLNNNPGKES